MDQKTPDYQSKIRKRKLFTLVQKSTGKLLRDTMWYDRITTRFSHSGLPKLWDKRRYAVRVRNDMFFRRTAICSKNKELMDPDDVAIVEVEISVKVVNEG